MTVTAGQLAHAIHTSVVAGTYPDSDDVYSADLPPNALPEIVAHLEKAREEVNEEIRRISRTSAPELDSWISQANRLQTDIAAADAKADTILALASQESELESELADAEAQQRFLEAEIRFNDELLGRLGLLQMVNSTLAQVADLSANGELAQAVVVLEGAERALGEMEWGAIVVELLKVRAGELRKKVVGRVEWGWGEAIRVDRERGEVRVSRDVRDEETIVGVEAVVEGMEALGLLSGRVDVLHQQLDSLLLSPLLDISKPQAPAFTVTGDTLKITGYSADRSAMRLFKDLRAIIDFLHGQLPALVTAPLSRILVSSLTTRLISSTLSHSVPSSLDHLSAFESLLAATRRFEAHLTSISWTRDHELSEWADRAPRVWLAKRKEACLDALRQTVAWGIRDTKIVERSETQTVIVQAKSERGGGGEWNEDWKDEEEEGGKTQAVTKEASKGLDMSLSVEDDDASGWGLDEDLDLGDPVEPELEKKVEKVEEKNGEEKVEEKKEEEVQEEELDWGEWGEDDEPTNDVPTTPKTADYTPTTSESAHSASPPHMAPPSMSKDVTLKETYTVTSIPDAILGLISTLIAESSTLARLPRNAITPAAPEIHTIPPLLLAAYRALAPLHYSHHPGALMHLYNDCTRLTSQLPATVPEADAALTSAFGKRVYSRELQSQRIILTDYLDSAQGFVNATSYPQSAACDTAIDSTIAHLVQLHTTWSSILSRSALSQSLGSILNTVCVRLVADIEDISDIAAAESERLAGLLERLVVGVEGLFPVSPGGVSMVAVYCAGWIKMRALQQVLESSMKEICYLWREGMVDELGAEELCELVCALFREGEGRKRCLEEIRGRGR